jgi:hypothetical protein
VKGRRGQKSIRAAVHPPLFPGYIGHELKGNSPALVLGQQETLRVLGAFDRLQQPVHFFSIHDVLPSSYLTIRLFAPGVVHDMPGVNTGTGELS